MYYLFVSAGLAVTIFIAAISKVFACGKKRHECDADMVAPSQSDIHTINAEASKAAKKADEGNDEKKKGKKKRRFVKPVEDKYILPSLFAALMFVLRYFSASRDLRNATLVDLDIIDPYRQYGLIAAPVSSGLGVLSTLMLWLEAAAILTVILYPFYDFKTANNAVKFFATPVFVICLGFLTPMLTLFCDFSLGAELNLSAAAMAAEIGCGLAICGNAWIRDGNLRISKKEALNLLLSVLPMLIAAFPPYLLQMLFGRANTLYTVKDLGPDHRAFLYASVLIPIAVYFALRNKSKEVIHYSILFLALATMISYSYNYTFADILTPYHWPLHLCNTAMYIIPICIIFKLDKLFYFTYFINVMGAFLAMAMPNYADGTNMFSTALVLFWINHFCAFFMPLLLVALKMFARPKFRQFWYSMAGFAVYFLLVLVINGWFSNYGDVDYFFLNSDFIVDKLGSWAEALRTNFVLEFDIGGLHFVYYPVYQVLFFVVYVGIAFAMWFVYEQFFLVADFHYDMHARNRKFRQDKYAMLSTLNGRSKTEPMYNDQTDKLILQGFGKRYGSSNVYAVKNADLEVHAGEIFGFLGPNGAGKSTIIKSIVGIQPITEGTIKVCGYDVEKQSVEAKRQIGYVPDHYALYERLTGREYINYIADIYDVGKEERDERIDRYVKLFELEGSIDNSMRTYSHGMKQKITIMAALVHNPRLWILDEPLTGLDPNSIYQVKECMKQHAKEGNIVFFSSHIIDVVERICDRITIIKKGKIICTRNVSEFGPDNTLEDFYLKTIEETDVERQVISDEDDGKKGKPDGKKHKKTKKAEQSE